MASPSPPTQSKPTNLMDLPLELRLQIYEYATIRSSPICINRAWQETSILGLGAHFCDHDIVTKLFYKHHAFVYNLTGLNTGEPNIQPLIDRLLESTPAESGYVKKISVVCFWACKDGTVETIQCRVEGALRKQRGEEFARSWVGKLQFAHTDKLSKDMWMG